MEHEASVPVVIRQALDEADVRINGDRPSDITVHDTSMFTRVLLHGSLGLGEAYMDGQWSCDSLDEFFHRILRHRTDAHLSINISAVFQTIRHVLMNAQTLSGSRKVAEQHYNLGNDWYERMLDPYMQYSCGYFKDTDDLATAQEKKLDLICQKLGLQPGMTLLDIGCGWGGLARFAAERYGAQVTGINISTEQIAYARKRTEGLPVEVRECDYRKIDGTFDRVVSVGMFEHVGTKNYQTYMQAVKHALKPDGLALIHTIGRNEARGGPEPWIEQYIFPNSILPAPTEIIRAVEPFFVMEDWHNFGTYYDKTLMAWYHNAEKAWPDFAERYGERFHRMWTYYLKCCAGAFRARSIQLWQLVLSPRGVEGGYQSVR